MSLQNVFVTAKGLAFFVLESLLNFLQDFPPLQNELNVLFYGNNNSKHEGPPERIPLLEEVFQLYPTMPLVLEVKGKTVELMELVKVTGLLVFPFVLGLYIFSCSLLCCTFVFSNGSKM